VVGDAGVGDDDVDPAELAHGRRHRRFQGVLVGDVALGPGVAGSQLGDELLQALGLHADRGDVRAVGGGPPGGLLADAAGGAGDEQDLVLQAAGQVGGHGVSPRVSQRTARVAVLVGRAPLRCVSR
jgi:hypothetical protein